MVGKTKSLKWFGKAVTAKMRAAQQTGVNQTMAAAAAEAKRNHDWQNRTGVLEGAIDIVRVAEPVTDGVRGTWGARDVAYARIHELGGTIRPVQAKFLAIPVSAEAERAGSPRRMGELAYAQSLKGQPLLVDRNSGDVHWVLKTEVKIPARPYLRPAADKEYPKLARRIKKAFERSGQGS
ncbi:phage morphogenesis protein [Stappia sp. F7233]|uniref:Phage morphogenesis protein n=1 Tax=Stappia albiluteola TaxID=2758565 RepID=A0A839AG18_9HYPH|nr:phage morphogenesis protein [Stappia albiluteola]MBA5778075.1 phage morphogenesis protein [Stappia albiluteola]